MGEQPDFLTAVDQDSAAPFGAIAYPELPGDLVTLADASASGWERLAMDLAETLAALHTTPSLLLGPLPAPDSGHLARLWSTVSGPLRQRLTACEWSLLSTWWDALLAGPLPSFPRRALVHADMWWENLLLSDGRITGVLDWEYLSLSDPAKDFGVVLGTGEEFFAHTLDHYRELTREPDDTLEHRARQLAIVREFYGIEYAARHDDTEWPDALASIRNGPILGG